MRAFWLFCLLAEAWSAGGPSRFVLTPSSPNVPLGTPFEITGTASFPERYQLKTDLRGQDTASFEILGVALGPRTSEGGMAVQPVRMRAAVFGLGQQTLPALAWTLAAPDGSSETLSSPPVRVDIQAPKPGPGDTGDIRDIVGPLSPTLWPWLAALAAILGALGLFLRRRRAHPSGAGQALDLRAPDELALDELEKLKTLNLPIKEFYDRMSDVLRAYFERRFGLKALAMTTQGLQRTLSRSSIDPEVRAMTKTLLERCDLVKFARLLPSSEESARDCETAKNIVGATRPPRPEPSPAAKP